MFTQKLEMDIKEKTLEKKYKIKQNVNIGHKFSEHHYPSYSSNFIGTPPMHFSHHTCPVAWTTLCPWYHYPHVLLQVCFKNFFTKNFPSWLKFMGSGYWDGGGSHVILESALSPYFEPGLKTWTRA